MAHERTLGGTTIYRLIYVDGRQRLEHRVVMERMIGRPLTTDEVVHHIDHDGTNNEPTNLELMTRAEHRRRHGGPRTWDIAHAVALWDGGISVERIASSVGVSYSAVWRAFARRGLPTRRAVRVDPTRRRWDRVEAARMRATGLPDADIAAAFGVTRNAITSGLKAHARHEARLK